MFLTNVTRPDLSFCVNFLSRFVNNFDISHWSAVKKVLRYLKGTCNFGILYKQVEKEKFILNAFSDSDFAGDLDQRKSTSGFLLHLANSPIIWFSRRQSVIALSTSEAEYIAASVGARDVIWAKRLLCELNFTNDESVSLHIDNESALQWCKYPINNRKTRHIELPYHFIRQQVELKRINVVKVSSDLQLADILTKNLSAKRFIQIRELIGIQQISKQGEY